MVHRTLGGVLLLLLLLSAVYAGSDCVEQTVDSCEGLNDCSCETVQEAQMCERSICESYETYSCNCQQYSYSCNPHNPHYGIVTYSSYTCPKQRCTKIEVKKELVCNDPYYGGKCVTWMYNVCVNWETYQGTCSEPIYGTIYDYDSCTGYTNCQICVNTNNCIQARTEYYECSAGIQVCKAETCVLHPEPRINDVKYENGKLEFNLYNILHGTATDVTVEIADESSGLKVAYEPYHIVYNAEPGTSVEIYIIDNIDGDEYFDEISVGGSNQVTGEYIYYPFIPKDVELSKVNIPVRYGDFIGFTLLGCGIVGGICLIKSMNKKKEEDVVNEFIEGLAGSPTGNWLSNLIANFKISFGVSNELGDTILDAVEHIINLIKGFIYAIENKLDYAQDRFFRSLISGLALIPFLGTVTGMDSLQTILKFLPKKFSYSILKKIKLVDMGVDAAEKFFKRLSDSDDTFVKKVIDLMDDTHTLSKIQKFADSVGDENFAAMLKNLSKDKIKKIINFDIPLDVGFKNTKFNYKFFEKNEEIFRDLVAKFKGKMDNVAKIEIGNFGKIKAGGYSVNTKILKLNAKLLLSEEEIYETAAHEFLHAIQFSKHASILGDASERTSMFYIKMLRNKMGDVVDTYTQSDGFNPLFNHFMDTGVNKLAMTSSDVDIDVWYKGWKKNYIGLIDSLENIPINSNFRSILDKISKEDLPNLIEIKIVFEKMEPDKVEVINKVISALGEDLSKEASNIYEIYKKIYENIKWVN